MKKERKRSKERRTKRAMKTDINMEMKGHADRQTFKESIAEGDLMRY